METPIHLNSNATSTSRRKFWRPRHRQLWDFFPWLPQAVSGILRNHLDKPGPEQPKRFGPRPEKIHQYSAEDRNDPPCTASSALVIIASFFVFVFFLGAQSSIQTATIHMVSAGHYVYRTGIVFNARDALTPLEMEVRQRHAIPVRFLLLLSPNKQFELLQLLSSKASDELLSSKTRRAVFVHIRDCKLEQCLRAIASAIAYSYTTERVAVLLIDRLTFGSLTELVALADNSSWSHHAMFISLDNSVDKLHALTGAVNDWAEFSVTEAFVPGQLMFNRSIQSPEKQTISTSYYPRLVGEVGETTGEYDREALTIGNTNIMATLDNLAAIDTHVCFSLSEVTWSKYSPRTIQEEILSDLSTNLKNGSDIRVSAEKASILGRRSETRNTSSAELVLKEKFRVPALLLRGMSPLARRLLLLKLMSKKRRGVKKPRAIFVHAQYGLGNRLRALGSAMAFARRTDRVLVLIWVPDQHLNCKYTDLFVTNDEFITSDGFDAGEEWPFKKAMTSDPAAKHVKWYNYMRINGVAPNTAEDEVKDDKEYHIYISTCYVIQSQVTPFIIRTQSSYWQVLRTLTPNIYVLRLVENFASYPMSSMIGIHIRGKKIKSDIDGVTADDYTEESSRRTDYWRNLTQVRTFIEEMRRQPLDQLFYVAADQKETFGRLEREFPSRVFYTPRRCDSRNRECLPFALADILLLARCSSLRGSYWSSFSELSVRIGGSRFLLAGIDFGRP